MGMHRAGTLTVAGVSVPLPCLFPSISSVKTRLRPVDYVEFLVTTGDPMFLISTHDVANASAEHRVQIHEMLQRAASFSER